ncbi:MAG: arsenite S-adenosylmethyltransferase [Candidatus Nephthysia bennettiae]|uniref:Arsenite methyltransferase n=1 Tax=Candidatus Nephthysia bennettiae TaxID=3127016 RepID=A0A934N8T5_9BACT|nr:arsenite methyltransferase [Candidatus Dormibacteraeota bacterium]PZR95840.1 MAG: arsenite S-adenosylmethyltransferase [Candidatus Dormibacteraeota bacterium]
MTEIREVVRDHYASKARSFGAPAAESCCGPECCSPAASEEGISCGQHYESSELIQVGLDSSISLGCGNPLLLADLKPGDVVLDLGSGGGLDVLLSARRVAPGGHAYGLDMTDEMLEVANRNKANAGIENASFLKGTIEQVPLPDGSVDVVISNCVINLAEDKGAVVREAFRVLKPGGRLAVSDMVELKELPRTVKKAVDAWAGCISGTIPVATYRQLLVDAGFETAEVEITQEHEVEGVGAAVASAAVRGRKPGA